MVKILNHTEIIDQLAALNHGQSPLWQYDGECLSLTLSFKDFASCFGFMVEIAAYMEEIDHHPDWSNSYNIVKIKLKTHRPKGITSLDFLLAQRINKVWSGLKG